MEYSSTLVTDLVSPLPLPPDNGDTIADSDAQKALHTPQLLGDLTPTLLPEPECNLVGITDSRLPEPEPECSVIGIVDSRLPEPEPECSVIGIVDSRLPEPEPECSVIDLVDSRLPEPEPECSVIDLVDSRLPEPEPECSVIDLVDSRLPEPEGECDLSIIGGGYLPQPGPECDLTPVLDTGSGEVTTQSLVMTMIAGDTFWFSDGSSSENGDTVAALDGYSIAMPTDMQHMFIQDFDGTDMGAYMPDVFVGEQHFYNGSDIL